MVRTLTILPIYSMPTLHESRIWALPYLTHIYDSNIVEDSLLSIPWHCDKVAVPSIFFSHREIQSV